MKKSIFTIVLCAALLAPGAVSAEALETPAGATVLPAEELSVVMPSSYEQYLNLNAPTDVAANDDYLAISDGNLVHLYSRATGYYFTYTHTVNADTRLNVVSCMEFGADGYLYFNDTSTKLYTLDCATLTARTTGLSCSMFTMTSAELYYATVTAGTITISQVSLGYIDSTTATPVKQIAGNVTPAMALWHDDICFTVGNMLYNPATGATVSLPAQSNVTDIAFLGETLYFTDASGKFYAFDMTTQTTLGQDSDTYSALGVYQSSVYVVDGRSVKEYAAGTKQFTDYEISSSSASVNRLKSATDVVLAGDYLLTADRGNKRVSVRNRASGETSVFETAIEPDIIATTEEKILISNGTAAAVYDFSGTQLTLKASFSGVITGVTGVYGTFYLVTNNNYSYRLAEDYALTSVAKTLDTTARSLTSDIDGNLYVLYANGVVNRYTEEEFCTANATGLNVNRFSNTVTKIFTDFAGNIYGMYENILYCSDGNIYEFRPDGAVYGEGYLATSYAIDYISQRIYMLCGDFILEANVPVRTLNTILVGGADKEIFSAKAAEVEVLRTRADTTCIAIDVAAMPDAAYFSYIGHGRIGEGHNALKLGETLSGYYVVAIYDEINRVYNAYLVNPEQCDPVPETEYLKEATEDFPAGKAYLSNDVALYKFPYLSDSLTLADLTRGTEVQVLGKLDFNGLDHNYYYISVTVNGRTYTGYIPTGYLMEFNGILPEEETVTYLYLTPDSSVTLTAENGTTTTLRDRTQVLVYGDWENASEAKIAYTKDNVTYFATVSTSLLESSTEGRWRTMTILILIAAAIIVGVDFLLLRKTDEDRDSFNEY